MDNVDPHPAASFFSSKMTSEMILAVGAKHYLVVFPEVHRELIADTLKTLMEVKIQWCLISAGSRAQ
jgi:hypothetical protein